MEEELAALKEQMAKHAQEEDAKIQAAVELLGWTATSGEAEKEAAKGSQNCDHVRDP